MSKSKSKKMEKTRRVNLCLSDSVYKWLCKIATGQNIMHGSKQSVGRLLSRQIESDYEESLKAGKAIQNLKPVVYEKRPLAQIKRADAKRKPTVPKSWQRAANQVKRLTGRDVSSPLNGLKSRKKPKIGP